MTVSDLQPVVTPPLPLPNVDVGPLSAPCWLPAIGHFIFSSARGYHLVASNGGLHWTIPVHYQPNGWLVIGSDLYVQDGCVISQYDLLALQRAVTNPLPDNACNLRTGLSWSAQQAGASLASIVSSADTTDLAYSAPVSAMSGPTRMVYVLSGAGRIFCLATNLTISAPPFASSLMPEPALGLFGTGEQRLARLRYLSADGKIVTLKVRPLGIESALSSGVQPAAWNGLNRAAASVEQWSYTLALAALPTQITVSSTSTGDTGGNATDLLTLTWVDPSTRGWHVLYLDSGAQPFKPARLEQARLASDGSGGPAPRLLGSPSVLVEDGATFLYALTAPPAQGSVSVSLQKFKLQSRDVTDINPWAWVATKLAAASAKLIVPWSQSAVSASAATPTPFGASAALRCLFSAFEAFGQDVSALEGLVAADWKSFASDVAQTMSASGVSAPGAAAALAGVATRWPGPQWLIAASAALQRAYGDRAQAEPVATTSAWRAAGLSPSQTLAALRVLYGVAVVTPGSDLTTWSGAFGPRIVDLEPAVWTAWQLNATREYGTGSVTDLTAAPRPEYRQPLISVLSALRGAYGLSASAFGSLLLHAGLLGNDLAESLQCSRAEAAAALTSAGFPPAEIARAVLSDRYGGVGGAIATMIEAGCQPADAAQAVFMVVQPAGQGAAGQVPDWLAQQLMAELKTAWDAAQPAQLTPADMTAAVAPFVRSIVALTFLKGHFDAPMESLADALKAAHGWDDFSAEASLAQVFGLTPTLRWMYATQGATANFDDPIDTVFEVGGGQPGPSDLAQAMSDAGIDASVTLHWLDQKANWVDYKQQVQAAVQAAYRMTPEEAASLRTNN